MFNASEDKHYLAMLAIPVLLSLMFGFSTNLSYDSLLTPRVGMDVGAEDVSAGKHSHQRRGKRVHDQNALVRTERELDKKQLFQLAIETRNYAAFLEAASGTPFGEIMTETAFDILVQEYQLQKHGFRPSPYTQQDRTDRSV